MAVFDRSAGFLRQRRSLLIACVVFLFVVIHLRNDYANITPIYWQGVPLKDSKIETPDWHWNYTKDRNNLQFNHRQCDFAFPDLFSDIDRLVRRHKAPAYKIRKAEIDKLSEEKINGFVRAMIYDQQLYIISTGGPVYSRSFAVLSQIHRAIITSPEHVPNIEFTFSVDDRLPPRPQWAFARAKEDTNVKGTWLMPDFGFWSWPETKVGSYDEIQKKALETEEQFEWADKHSKLLWRGATMGLELRDELINVTRDKSWADVMAIDWHDKQGVVGLKSMDEHCQYKYLVHTEGNSYSGRLKYLQQCRSVLLSPPMEWVTHYSHLMRKENTDRTDQNYIEVKRDWSDLESKIKHLQSWDGLGERIAKNSVDTFRER